jgi:hypothetical protein
MKSSFTLLYDAASQTAITCIDHKVVRWSVAVKPQRLAEYTLEQWTQSSLLGWVSGEQAIALVRFHPPEGLPVQPANVTLELRHGVDFSLLWQITLPDDGYPEQSEVACLDAHRLIGSRGQTLVLLDAATGGIKAEYKLDAMVLAIAIDVTNHRVVAATANGIVVVPIKEFDLTVSERRSQITCHLPPNQPQASTPTLFPNQPPPTSTPTEHPKLSTWEKLFVGFIALVGLGGTGLIVWPLPLLLLANLYPTALIDQSYSVGRYQVSEQVYNVGFLDHAYERVYTVKDGWWRTEIGRFVNEENPQLGRLPPKLVGDWLVVFSGNHLFLWRSGRSTIAFTPDQAVGWSEYANQPTGDINGHYDYHAADFWIQDNRWLVEYRCSRLSCQKEGKSALAKIRFVSEDQGKTFHLLNHRSQPKS